MLLNQMLSTTPPFVINKKNKIKERKKSKKESEIKTTLYWNKQRKYKVETKTNKEASKKNKTKR